MRLYFKPYAGLTIVTVISLIILISLGYWQSQRLVWKTNLLEQVEISANSEPFTAISQVEQALAANRPIDFQRIMFEGKSVSPQTPKLVYFRQKNELSWRPYLATESQGRIVYVAREPVSDSFRDDYASQTIEGVTQMFSGYVRLARGPARGEAKSTPNLNRWFSFNPLPETDPWGQAFAPQAETRFYIDAVAGAKSADRLPVKRPDIRNNHFDYMLTWYGLALCLFIIYLIMHRRGDRLGLRRKASS